MLHAFNDASIERVNREDESQTQQIAEAANRLGRSVEMREIISRDLTKKRAGPKPCSKNCVDPVCPAKFGFEISWRDDAAFLRVGAPPETWTTKRRPCGLPAIKFVD
jgi:hypothetical protein